MSDTSLIETLSAEKPSPNAGRPNDTHETIAFEPGIDHVRRQREYTPQGWRRVED